MLSAGATCLLLLCLPPALTAQTTVKERNPWTLRLRAAISGSSYESDPAGYKIYSGIGLEGAVERGLGRVASLELAFRTKSREVLGPASAGGDERLGSLEMLPVTLLARWRPRGRGAAATSARPIPP